jgi:hypothetical protein
MGGVEAGDELLAREEGDPHGLARVGRAAGAEAADRGVGAGGREAVVVLLAGRQEPVLQAHAGGVVAVGLDRHLRAVDDVGEIGFGRDLEVDDGRAVELVEPRPQRDRARPGLAGGHALAEHAVERRRAGAARHQR